MALIRSLAETMNIGWSVAASKAAGSLDDRVQDLAFRREVLAVVRDELGHSRLPTPRELSKLLNDGSVFALAVDPENPSVRTAASQRAGGGALAALDEDAQARLLSALAASVAAVAIRSADPAIRLLNAKLDDVTNILLTLLDIQPDLLARVNQALEASEPLANQPIWVSNEQLGGRLTGRDSDLAWLDRIDSGIVVLHAIGGAGKTQLALHHGGRRFTGLEVFALVPASSSSQLSSGLLDLARRLGLPSPPEVHPDESVAAVKDWLATTSKWLLVFDAAVGMDEIAPFLPTRVAGQLIITTTSPLGWDRIGEVRAIEPLAEEAAVQLLCEISGQSPGPDAEDLAKRLDRWPLALVQAASFCRSTGTSLRNFLSLCDEALPALLADAQTAPIDHPATTVATVGLAFDAVQGRSPAAGHLLELCSVAGQAPIGLRLFTAPELLGGALGDVAADPLELARVVAEARRFSLVDRVGDNLVMHRVVGELLRQQLDDVERLKRLEELVGLLSASLPDDVQNPTTWLDWDPLVEHVQAAGQQLLALEGGGVAFGVLLDRLATYLENQWDLDAAIRWFESSIAHLKRIDAPADTLLGVRSNHAHCMMKIDPAEAEALFLELLEAHREVHGDAARSMSGYADVEQALGRLARSAGQLEVADSYLLSALATYSRAIAESEWFRSKAVCDCLNNLGLVKLDSLGPKAAIPEFERARRLNEAGDRPNEVARNLSNIGVAHHRSGDSDKAETSHRAALQLRIELLGDKHPDTNLSRGEVASTLRQRAASLMRDAATSQLAVELLTEAVALDREALHHLEARPRALSARAGRLNGLGLDLLDLYRATGSNDSDLAEQAETSLKAAAELRAVSEPHTAGTAQSTTNLGRLYVAAGQRSAARDAFGRAIALLRRRGGAPTITEALAHHWLAQIAAQDDPAGDGLRQALDHGERSLDIYRSLTGLHSASTRRAEEAIAHYRRMLGSALAQRLESIQTNTGITGRDVALLIDTTPQTVSRWRTGQSSPQPRHLERLLTLDWLAAQLVAYYTPEEAKLWLFSPHPLLDGARPADLIADGRTDEVLQLIDQLDSAAYI